MNDSLLMRDLVRDTEPHVMKIWSSTNAVTKFVKKITHTAANDKENF